MTHTEASAESGNAREAWSSVELTKNAKGSYQWAIKVYVPAGDELESLVPTVAIIDLQLRDRFGEPPKGTLCVNETGVAGTS